MGLYHWETSDVPARATGGIALCTLIFRLCVSRNLRIVDLGSCKVLWGGQRLMIPAPTCSAIISTCFASAGALSLCRPQAGRTGVHPRGLPERTQTAPAQGLTRRRSSRRSLLSGVGNSRFNQDAGESECKLFCD